MKTTYLLAGGFAASLATAQASAITLDLASPHHDLSAIAVGESVVFELRLTGLTPGATLEFLPTTVLYDGLTPLALTTTPGPVIPDTAGFFGNNEPGSSNNVFDTASEDGQLDAIASNGVFVSLQTTAQTLGPGSLTIDFADALGSTATEEPINGIDLGVSRLDFEVVLPGDTNADGDVDLDDLTTLSNFFDQAGNRSQGDFNGDAMVDLDDLTIMGSYFGYGVATPASSFSEAIVTVGLASAVPEPSTAAIALILAGVLKPRRRR